jgi:tetrapyrrole methylase family protein/MazG family protein
LDVQGLPAPFFHSEPEHYSFELLKESGLDVNPAPTNASFDGTLLIPDRTGPLYDLVHVVDRLLGPGGCPWDIEQTHESLKKYLLEEAYEVLDAIDTGSPEKLREELGDLLLQPLMHSQMEARDGAWGIDEVARTITEKLIRRHPHVFGEATALTPDQVLKNWDQIKRQEKADGPASILDGIPKGMASLLRAHEVSKRAARSGFEWPDMEGVFSKLKEEELEIRHAIESGNQEQIESEIGDLLFTVVNIARWAHVEPEEALRKMLNRFCARFALMEQNSAVPLSDLSAAEWDRLWNESKRQLNQVAS